MIENLCEEKSPSKTSQNIKKKQTSKTNLNEWKKMRDLTL